MRLKLLILAMLLPITALATLGNDEKTEKIELQDNATVAETIVGECKFITFDYKAGAIIAMSLNGKILSELFYKKDGTIPERDFIKFQLQKYSEKWYAVPPLLPNTVTAVSENKQTVVMMGIFSKLGIHWGLMIVSKEWIDHISNYINI